jgi:hypothetical protein
MQNGFSHAVSILFALMLAVPHVYVGYDLAPSCAFVKFRHFFFVVAFLSNVLSCPGIFLFLLAI